MKKLLLTLLALHLPLISVLADGPWKVKLFNEKEKNTLAIDLYEETVNVPGMEDFGPMNGYLNGLNIYGVWMVTSFDIKSDTHAVIRMSNDLGSDTQECDLKITGDSIYTLTLLGKNYVKKVVNKKFAKASDVQVFKIK